MVNVPAASVRESLTPMVSLSNSEMILTLYSWGMEEAGSHPAGLGLAFAPEDYLKGIYSIRR